MKLTYAGIGARKTPADILKIMEEAAKTLQVLGYTLYSGGAVGADSAFEKGAGDKKVIFEPYSHPEANWKKAEELVDLLHPRPHALTTFTRRLMARNAFQVLGPKCEDPVQFVMCWTPDGATTTTSVQTGGTGHAIRIANKYNIEVLNLAQYDHKEMVLHRIEEDKLLN